jgi:hypothetical protein
MKTVLQEYKKTSNKEANNDVMGLIRIMFPDMPVETFLEKRGSKDRKRKNVK